jgi:hypothetical protein
MTLKKRKKKKEISLEKAIHSLIFQLYLQGPSLQAAVYATIISAGIQFFL